MDRFLICRSLSIDIRATDIPNEERMPCSPSLDQLLNQHFCSGQFRVIDFESIDFLSVFDKSKASATYYIELCLRRKITNAIGFSYRTHVNSCLETRYGIDLIRNIFSLFEGFRFFA